MSNKPQGWCSGQQNAALWQSIPATCLRFGLPAADGLNQGRALNKTLPLLGRLWAVESPRPIAILPPWVLPLLPPRRGRGNCNGAMTQTPRGMEAKGAVPVPPPRQVRLA